MSATAHFPPTRFFYAFKGQFDAVVAMYHDQSQIAMKLMGFNKGIAVTAGLKTVFTTPAHGTAYDIAGLGRANVEATWQAFQNACRMGTAYRASAQ